MHMYVCICKYIHLHVHMNTNTPSVSIASQITKMILSNASRCHLSLLQHKDNYFFTPSLSLLSCYDHCVFNSYCLLAPFHLTPATKLILFHVVGRFWSCLITI